MQSSGPLALNIRKTGKVRRERAPHTPGPTPVPVPLAGLHRHPRNLVCLKLKTRLRRPLVSSLEGIRLSLRVIHRVLRARDQGQCRKYCQ
jgi:hypothetical protein